MNFIESFANLSCRIQLDFVLVFGKIVVETL